LFTCPTGGIIYGKSGIVDAYRTGKGRLHIRGKYHFEEEIPSSFFSFTNSAIRSITLALFT
jgi:DNA gyrase/topoisomerase IV subunit A